jgi:hypothetical protein
MTALLFTVLTLMIITVESSNHAPGCPQGMPIDSSVAELLTAQLFVLVQEAPDPIYFYINSTGIAVSGWNTAEMQPTRPA